MVATNDLSKSHTWRSIDQLQHLLETANVRRRQGQDRSVSITPRDRKDTSLLVKKSRFSVHIDNSCVLNWHRAEIRNNAILFEI